ncbi:Alcohol acetyltransferase [Madurella fahalii]|uniref:Alcohol acetyltransferase n=1 Tax=Madurella fahalii TaxID=1157608 RepID=A0ABQ0GCK7_9PEZI
MAKSKSNREKCGTETTAVLRKFGINETYQLAMYLLDQYRGTILSCRYEIPPRLAPAESRAQLEEVVRVAVVDTIMRHPMLQVGMIDATSKTPSWIQLPSLDLTQHIQWLYPTGTGHADFEQTVHETFCAQLDDRFPDLSIRQPGWKITVIRQGNAPIMEVLLTWNHPQFDAVGAKVFHEDLLEMLNALLNAGNTLKGAYERTGLDGDLLVLPQAVPLLPTPIEGLKRLPVDLKHLAKALWEETRYRFLLPSRDVSLAAWCPIRPSPYKTQFRAFFVDNPSLLAIQALCRQHQTTITGLLNGLALIAFSSHLDAAVAPAFQSSTIVDHRRNLPPAPPDAPWVRSDRAVSNYVTQCFHRWDTELVAQVRSKLPAADAADGSNAGSEGSRHLSAELEHELWTASARNRREIVDKLAEGLRNDLVGLFKYVTDWQQTMRNLAKRPRQFSWLVTNIGVLDGIGAIPTTTTTTSDTMSDTNKSAHGQQRWSISRAQFGLSTEVPMAAIEFSPVSVAGRGMCVSATWADCAVEVTLGERIMADMERWMAQLASQS